MVFIFDSENEGLSLKIQSWPRSDCLAYSPGRGCVDLDLQLIPRLPGNQNGVYLSLCTSQNTVFLSRRASNMSWSRPQFPRSTHGMPWTMTPLLAHGDQLRLAFYELGLWRSLVTRIYSCLQLNTAVRKSAITNIKSSNNLVVTNQRLVKTDTVFNQEWKESSGPSFALEASKVTVK